MDDGEGGPDLDAALASAARRTGARARVFRLPWETGLASIIMGEQKFLPTLMQDLPIQLMPEMPIEPRRAAGGGWAPRGARLYRWDGARRGTTRAAT